MVPNQGAKKRKASDPSSSHEDVSPSSEGTPPKKGKKTTRKDAKEPQSADSEGATKITKRQTAPKTQAGGKKEAVNRKPPKKPPTKKKLKEDRKVAVDKLRSVEQENNELKEIIEQMKKEAFRSISNSNPALDDSVIRDRFAGLRTATYAWSGNYACEGPVPELSQVVKDELIETMSALEWVNCREEDFLMMAQHREGCCLFLNTLLATFLYGEIISKPLASVSQTLGQLASKSGDNESVGSKRLKFDPKLQQVADLIKKNGKYKAATWISQTLEAVYPTETGLSDDETVDGLQTSFEAIADEFLGGPVKPLIRTMTTEEETGMKQELMRLFRKASALCIDIWKQSVDIGFHFLGSKELGEIFQVDSDILVPHNIMWLTVDDDAEPASGGRLVIVVEPAITAHWVDTSGNERSKIWAKAVVWAENPEKPQLHGNSEIEVAIKIEPSLTADRISHEDPEPTDLHDNSGKEPTIKPEPMSPTEIA